MIRDLSTRTLKICQSVFIKNLIEKKNFTNYNAPIIPIKVRSAIKINDLNNYNETNLIIYLQLIRKLIYLTYKLRFDITFVVKRLSKHNANPCKRHFNIAK